MPTEPAFYEFDGPRPRRLVRKDARGDVAELTAAGWRYAPWLGSGIGDAAVETDVDALKSRCRQRLNRHGLLDASIAARDRGSSTPVHGGSRSWLGARLWRLTSWVLPPLPYGTPSRFDRRAYADAENECLATLKRLEDNRLEVSLDQARRGYQSQDTRLQGIETRAGAFEGYATATAGLVAIGAAVLSGSQDLRPQGALEYGLAALLLYAMWCLVVSGFRGWQAAFKRIDRARPYESQQVFKRASETDLRAAQRIELAALLVAEHRDALLEDWKLDRLKQSSRFFALALIAVLLAALLLLVSQSART